MKLASAAGSRGLSTIDNDSGVDAVARPRSLDDGGGGAAGPTATRPPEAVVALVPALAPAPALVPLDAAVAVDEPAASVAPGATAAPAAMVAAIASGPTIRRPVRRPDKLSAPSSCAHPGTVRFV